MKKRRIGDFLESLWLVEINKVTILNDFGAVSDEGMR